MRVLENIIYDELQDNDYATFTKTLSEESLILFAASSEHITLSGLDPEAIRNSVYREDIGYGMWASSLISNAFSKVMPGPGSIYLEQDLSFSLPVKLGDTLTVKLTVKEKLAHNRVIFLCDVQNQEAQTVVTGEAIVIAPSEKISLEQESLPKVCIHTNNDD
jgi:3-hydroxybutyryl-CoA dehydratase